MPPEIFKHRIERFQNEEKLNEILENMDNIANDHGFIREMRDEQQRMLEEHQKLLDDIRKEITSSFIEEHAEYQPNGSGFTEGDRVRLNDKVMLRIFSAKLLEKNYNNETLQPEGQELLDFFRKLETEDYDPSHADASLQAGEDPLKRILQDVEFYSRFNYTTVDYKNDGASEEAMHIEGRLTKRIFRRLNALMDTMNAQNEEANKEGTGNFADDDRMFIVSNLLNYFEAQLSGKLGLVPEQQVSEDMIHFTYVGKYMGVSKFEQPMAGGEAVPDKMELAKDLGSQPLFPHVPSPHDVRQEQIGDCWFLAILSGIAAKRPEKIEEMMCDNHDGTVTVRFYHRVSSDPQNGFEPFYVTVDKARSEGQADECLWVDVLERALAVSGMGPAYQDAKNEYFQIGEKDPQYCPHPKFTDPPSLEGISGCADFFAMELLLGDDVKTHRTVLNQKGAGPMTDAEVTPIDIERHHIPKGEQKLAESLTKMLKQGAVIGTYTRPPIRGAMIPTLHGLDKLHEYALIGLERRNIPGIDGELNPHYFVKLCNPHGSFGRDYRVENGKLQAFSTEGLNKGEGNGIFNIAGDNNGIAFVEMGDFLKEFYGVTWGDVKKSSLEREQHIANEERNVLKSYTKSLKEINSYLDDNIPLLSSNSKEYRDMKGVLKDAVKNPAKNYLELKKQLEKIDKFVKIYQRHSDRVEGKASLRVPKKAACDAFMIIREAAQQGYMRPKAYACRVLADKMIESYLNQDKNGLEEEQVKQVMKKIEVDRLAFCRNVQNTAEFRQIVPRESTIVNLSEILKNYVPVGQIRAEQIDNTYVTRENRTIGDVRAANPGLLRQP